MIFSKTTIFCSLLFWLTIVNTAVAQQDAQYTQYMYNTISVNPAYAGSRGHTSIAAIHRSQWVGLEGAPTTQTLNVNAPLGYNGLGIGFSVVNDKIGPTSETNFDLDLSYTIKLSGVAKLSFGVKASANLLDIRFSELNQLSGDVTLEQDIDNRLSPNIGAGLYYYTDNSYLGISIPRFLETSHFQETSLSVANEQMNLYLIGGYVWDLNRSWKFKPSFLTKLTEGAPLQVDISANFMYNEKFVLGAAYRLDAAVSGLFGFNLSRNMFLGVAYDHDTTALGDAAFNSGSFELVVRYDFISIKDRIKSPRFF